MKRLSVIILFLVTFFASVSYASFIIEAKDKFSASIPEPVIMLLFGACLVSLTGYYRKKIQSKN